ncbi:MAG: ArsR family transcriptional regulator [Dehalococcoidia bacterium]|nr:ArsR family transcriptional regulator [Dehalococcoidia bacterium]
MESSRDRILALILERREARVEELATELKITTAAVRRHLDHLRADGLIDVKPTKQSTGRPYHSYRPTSKAAGALPTAYADLLKRMLASLGERTEVVDAIMESIAEALAARHREDVGDDAEPELRVELVTDVMRSEGILESWHTEDDGFHMTNGVCPYLEAAEFSKLPCESDRKAIELLMGLEVEQLHRIVDGSPTCGYLVRALPGQSELIEISEEIASKEPHEPSTIA